MKIPVYEQALDETLTLVELVRTLNTDRAALRQAHISAPLSWTDIAGQDDDGNLQFWRDVPVDQRPADKRHLV
jgi:hypothetical protein